MRTHRGIEAEPKNQQKSDFASPFHQIPLLVNPIIFINLEKLTKQALKHKILNQPLTTGDPYKMPR